MLLGWGTPRVGSVERATTQELYTRNYIKIENALKCQLMTKLQMMHIL